MLCGCRAVIGVLTMGNRVEGKAKRKSVKAKQTSTFSSKRRLSRKGKVLKKGHQGPSADFLTRSSVLKKLQITLKDFRRLCILKGIFPRVPKKMLNGKDRIYYHVKDISYLAHEPLLHKFREFKTFMKKIRRAVGRHEIEDARRLNASKPTFDLQHLVKERYPRFIDALRDLDDCLCMIHLFASLPAERRVTAEHTTLCKRLCREWQYYIARTHTLTKVFVSVKGYYFQAEVLGEPVTWLVPHQFKHVVPKEVDVRVLVTFLEFYEVFLKFALFKLYHGLGVRYPPNLDEALESRGAYLSAFRPAAVEEGSVAMIEDTKAESVDASTNASREIEDVGSATPKQLKKQQKESKARIASLEDKFAEMGENEGDDDEDDGVSIAQPLESVFNDMQGEDRTEEEQKTFEITSDDPKKRLFAGMRLFLNREVPQQWLEFCLVSFGGVVGWEGEGSPFTADDETITHHIVDRPLKMDGMPVNRDYVQPQWVFDSINNGILLPIDKYAPGKMLPPHLSPFVDDANEGYVPKYKQTITAIKSAAERAAQGLPTIEESDNEGGEHLDADDDEEEAYAENVKNEYKGVSFTMKKKSKNDAAEEEEDDDGDDDDDDDEDEENDSEEPVEDAAAPVTRSAKKGPRAIAHTPKVEKKTEAEELRDMSQIMMSKKTRRLYGRIQHGIEKKQGAVDTLVRKRKQLEEQEDAKAGKTTKKEPKSVSKRRKSKN